MENILISSCLLGNNTKYNGGNNYIEEIELLKQKYNLIPICPEFEGGLSIPRLPSEIINDKVISKDGTDVTLEYNKGAKIALEKAKQYNCKIAILKEKSPSCGKYYTYDGTFSNQLVKRSGVCAKLLLNNGIDVFNEKEIFKLIEK